MWSQGMHSNGSASVFLQLQWNPSITGTFGEQCFGLYTEVAFVERLCVLYTNCSFGTWVPGRYIATGLYSEVVVKGGSTVYSYATNYVHPTRKPFAM